MKNVFLKYNTLGPVSHLSPPVKGSKAVSEQRTLKVVVDTPEGKKIERLPVLGGGSARGKNRRRFIIKVLNELGYYENNLLVGLKQETFESLIAGGRQAYSTEQAANVEKYISLYSDLPFLGLFGGVPYSVFFEGRLSVGFAIPMLEETRYLLEKSNSPYAHEDLPRYENYLAFQDTHSYTRVAIKNIKESEEVDFTDLLTFLKEKEHDLAVAAFEEDINNYNEKLIEAKEKEGDVVIPKLALPKLQAELKANENLRTELGVKLKMPASDYKDEKKVIRKITNMFNLQMLFNVINPIPAGLNLHSIICLKDGLGNDKLMKATFDAFIETMLEGRFIGGMHNKGFGQVTIEAKLEDGSNFMDTSNAEYFWNWLEENREKVKNILETLDKYLVTAPIK